MSRRSILKKKVLKPDPVYNSALVHNIVNNLMKKGKKALSYRMFYGAMTQIQEKTQQDPITVVEKAVANVQPDVIVKARRVGGSTYQVPLKIEKELGQALAIRWILSSCRNRSGITMVSKLTNEFLDAWKKTGNAIRKKEEVHRMAEANKVFARNRF